MVNQEIGPGLTTPLLFAVLPQPLDPTIAVEMGKRGRSGEIAIIGDQRHWIMGRIANADYTKIFEPIRSAVAIEVNSKKPSMETGEEYRFKLIHG